MIVVMREGAGRQEIEMWSQGSGVRIFHSLSEGVE